MASALRSIGRQRAHPELLIPDDDWLHGAGSRVVVGWNINGEPIDTIEMESFGDALFVRPALMTPHIL